MVQTAEADMIAQFGAMSLFTVAAAGFLDGINPCAFTTLIFFISYLALLGRGRQEIVWVGGAFTLAVFLTYLAMGFGLAQIVQYVSGVSLIGRIIYGVSIALCALLAVLSLVDYVRVRRGHPTGILLQLPRFLKLRIHAVVRRQSRARAYVLGAFVTGVLVSVFELACTGQVYLPTLVFMSGLSETRLAALGYLLLYNAMFVVPLLVIFGLTYVGTTQQQFTTFFQSHMAAVKLLTVCLFAALAIWLFVTFPGG
jgi:cytochrome c biogenesis protein CcdA